MKNRDNGFYWVRFEGEVLIAEYIGLSWYITQCSCPVLENKLDFIDENKINPPSEMLPDDDIVGIKHAYSHKGYVGCECFEPRDNCFYGKIEHISHLVTYEADDVKDLKSAFIEAVDDHIAFCEEKGCDPRKTI